MRLLIACSQSVFEIHYLWFGDIFEVMAMFIQTTMYSNFVCSYSSVHEGVSLWCFGGTLECLMFPSGFLVWLPFSNVWYFFTVCTSTCWHLILVTGGNVHHTRVCITCGLSDGFLWFMWFYSSLKCFRIRCSDCLPDNAKVESCCLLIFIYSWCLYHCCCFILRTVWSWFESWLGILTGILNLES